MTAGTMPRAISTSHSTRPTSSTGRPGSRRPTASAGPQRFLPPRHSFTVLLPARHEEAVIYETVRSVWAADYPRELLEVARVRREVSLTDGARVVDSVFF